MTRRNIEYMLSKSPFKLSMEYDRNYSIVYYFSSKNHFNKFIEKYKDNRIKINESLSNRFNIFINFDIMCDIIFYAKVESRGFYININGGIATCLNQIILGGEKAIPKN